MWARSAPHLYIGVAVGELCERLSPDCYMGARFSHFRVYAARIHIHSDLHTLLRNPSQVLVNTRSRRSMEPP